MSAMRHRILHLGLQGPNLREPVAAWSFYGPSDAEGTAPGSDEKPPYATPLQAMRDGWRLLQAPRLPDAPPGAELRAGSLAYECLLEKEITDA